MNLKQKLRAVPGAFRRNLGKLSLVPVAMFPALSHAALATEVTTAMTNADTDTKALAALVFIVVLGLAVYKWFHRTVR